MRGSSQNWFSSGPVTFSGPVRLTLWSAMANFNTTQARNITLSLWDCNTSVTTCTQMGATVTSAVGGWSGGSSTRAAKEFNLGTINRQTTRLQLRLGVNTASASAMMFAYDTTTYPSRITSG